MQALSLALCKNRTNIPAEHSERCAPICLDFHYLAALPTKYKNRYFLNITVMLWYAIVALVALGTGALAKLNNWQHPLLTKGDYRIEIRLRLNVESTLKDSPP